MATVTEIQERTRIIDVGKTESVSTKRYKIECSAGEDEEDAYAALIAAVPPATPYGTVSPFNVMFPTKYRFERAIEPGTGFFWGQVDFSSKSENAIEYEHRTGTVTMLARKDKNGILLPAGERAYAQQQCETFVYRRTEIAIAWGKDGAGAPAPLGKQWQRVSYARGRVNAVTWLGKTAGYWLFIGADSVYQADATHRVEYRFAGKSWAYGGADQILWEYIADDGSLYEINGEANFATVFSDFVWPDGSAIT